MFLTHFQNKVLREAQINKNQCTPEQAVYEFSMQVPIFSSTASQRMEYEKVSQRQYHSLCGVTFAFKSISLCPQFSSFHMLLSFYGPLLIAWWGRNCGRGSGKLWMIWALWQLRERDHFITETWELFVVHVNQIHVWKSLAVKSLMIVNDMKCSSGVVTVSF